MKLKPSRTYKDEEIVSMTQLLKQGDRTMIARIVDAHLEMANKIAGSFAKRFPGKYHDIMSSAYFGLVQGVNWSAEGRLNDDKITPYLAVTVRRFVRDFLESDFLIPIPRKEFKKRMEDEDVRDYINRTMSLHLAVPEHRIAFMPNIPIMHSIDMDHENDEAVDWRLEIPYWDESPFEMEDLFFKLHLTSYEADVIKFRLEDYTLHEIANEMGRSHEWVRGIIGAVKKKLVNIGISPVLHTHAITGKRTCTKCEIEKSLSEFYKQKDAKDGYKSICKECIKNAKHCTTV